MIWDLPNFLVCLIAIFAAFLVGKIKLSHALCLALLSGVPFCLNGVLFDPSYMPDQFTYWRMLSTIRDGSYNSNFYNTRVTEASYIYAFFPLPFVETVSSLGFFNKFLLILIFIWTASVLKLRGWILWFLLLYPSLILYSSLGLRDMLICSFMLLALWLLLQGWYGLSLLCLVVLTHIKMQNALLVGLFSMGYLAAQWNKAQFNLKKILLLVALLLVCAYFAFPLIIDKVEYYRLRMYLEDGGIFAEYQPIMSFSDFLFKGIFGIVRGLFYPLPWQASGIFQLLQAFENLGIALLLTVFTWNSYRLIPKQTLLWLLFLLSGMFMYGLVVNNVGTIVRYKLPFIVVYCIFLSYERRRSQQAQRANSQPWTLSFNG